LRAVEKPDPGFTVWVPETWTEYPPRPSNSPYEVARFRYRDEGRHICLIFRHPGLPGLTPRAAADQARRTLEAKGFEHFNLEEVSLDGRAAIRMDYDTTRFDFGPWFVREYFLVDGDISYVLGLGSGRPTVDRATYDEMAARFHLQ
jgi:hypothetical protein